MLIWHQLSAAFKSAHSDRLQPHSEYSVRCSCGHSQCSQCDLNTSDKPLVLTLRASPMTMQIVANEYMRLNTGSSEEELEWGKLKIVKWGKMDPLGLPRTISFLPDEPGLYIVYVKPPVHQYSAIDDEDFWGLGEWWPLYIGEAGGRGSGLTLREKLEYLITDMDDIGDSFLLQQQKRAFLSDLHHRGASIKIRYVYVPSGPVASSAS